jgi:hypothetical protein
MIPFPAISGCGVNLATHLNLILIIRMRGGIPPFIYVFMAYGIYLCLARVSEDHDVDIMRISINAYFLLM